VADRAIQRELAHAKRPGEIGADLAAGHEDAECHGEIIGRALFAQVGRRQVDRDPRVGELAIRVADGGLHPLARFLHGDVREPHDDHEKEAIGDIYLDFDERAFQADHRATGHFGEHGWSPAMVLRAV